MAIHRQPHTPPCIIISRDTQIVGYKNADWQVANFITKLQTKTGYAHLLKETWLLERAKNITLFHTQVLKQNIGNGI